MSLDTAPAPRARQARPVKVPDTAATLTKGQVAGMLQCSERKVERLDSQGLIPGRIKLGRSIRWNRAAVQRWLDEGCPEPRRR